MPGEGIVLSDCSKTQPSTIIKAAREFHISHRRDPPLRYCLLYRQVVSSKERFGKEFPGQPTCWQIAAFSYVTNRHLFCPGAGVQIAGSGERDAREGHGGGDPRRESGIVRSAAASGSSGSGTKMREGKGVECAETTTGSETEEEERRGGEHVEVATVGDAADKETGTLVAVSTASRAREDKSAMRTLRDHHPNIVAKTVALIQGPTPSELRKQLDLLSESFAWMFGHPRRESSSSSQSPAYTSTKPTTATSLETTTTTSNASTAAATEEADGASTARTSTSPTTTSSSSTTGMSLGVQHPYLAHLARTRNNHSLIEPRKVIDRCDTGGNESDTRTNTTDTNTTDSRSAEDGEFLTWGDSGGGGSGGGFLSPGAPSFSTLSAASGMSEDTMLGAASGRC